MKFILVRHGETEEERSGIILGNIPGTLSRKGIEEAKKTAAMIKEFDQDPEVIFSSDLRRALDYATLIGKELGLHVRSESLLRERGAGNAEGLSEDKIDWKSYEKGPKPLRKHAGGESFEDVRLRAKEFLKKISSEPFKEIVIISHSVFLAMFTMEVSGWEFEDALRYDFREPMVVVE
jgi:broad specificity phosphatase PhoE